MAIKKSDLYSSLWKSCDELRGGMDASQYKDYVFVMLFIKYISDKYSGVPYAPIKVPAGASFKDMVALKGKTTIGDDINKKIIGVITKENNLTGTIDVADFNNAKKLGSGKEMVDRLSSGSAKRKPWKKLFFQENWQEELTPDAAGAYQTPLEMVRLAPSATNQQPWRIVKQGNVFHFFLQSSPWYEKLAGSTDMQRLDMGIAMCHFELTTEEVGLEGEWIETEPDLTSPERCDYLVSWKGN